MILLDLKVGPSLFASLLLHVEVALLVGFGLLGQVFENVAVFTQQAATSKLRLHLLVKRTDKAILVLKCRSERKFVRTLLQIFALLGYRVVAHSQFCFRVLKIAGLFRFEFRRAARVRLSLKCALGENCFVARFDRLSLLVLEGQPLKIFGSLLTAGVTSRV